MINKIITILIVGSTLFSVQVFADPKEDKPEIIFIKEVNHGPGGGGSSILAELIEHEPEENGPGGGGSGTGR